MVVVDGLSNSVVIANIVLSFAKSIGNFKSPFMVGTTHFLNDWLFRVLEICANSFDEI